MGVVRDTQDDGKFDYRDLIPKEQDFTDVLIEHVMAVGKATNLQNGRSRLCASY